jgi:hypothetical protein
VYVGARDVAPGTTLAAGDRITFSVQPAKPQATSPAGKPLGPRAVGVRLLETADHPSPRRRT